MIALLENFGSWLTNERYFSPRTARCYSSDMEQFAAHIADATGEGLLRATTEQIATYLDGARPLYKPTTLLRKAASLRTFYKFCVVKGLITANPAKGITMPKVPEAEPKAWLTDEEMRRLLNAAQVSPRDAAIISVLGYCGLRVHELNELRVQDVDLTALTLRVGKRVVPMNFETTVAIRGYLASRFGEQQDPAAPLFINKFGDTLTTRSVRRRLAIHAAEAKIDKHISPHVLRRSCAAHMVFAGKREEEVMGQLGVRTPRLYDRSVFEQPVVADAELAIA